MVDSIFAFYGITAAIISRGVQAPLHISAKLDVFPLNFLAERNRALRALASFFGARFVKKPFEDGQRLFVGQGDNQVCGNIIGIDVEHEVGKNPEVQSFLRRSRARSVSAIGALPRTHSADRRELL